MKGRRRRRFKMDSLTPVARAIWRAAFNDEPWPRGWRVEWAGFMRGAMGLAVYSERRVLLSFGDLMARPKPVRIVVTDENGEQVIYRNERSVKLSTGEIRPFVTHDAATAEALDQWTNKDRDPLRTLIHEMIHMRCGHDFRHGKEFERLVEAAYARAWVAAA